MAWFSKGFLIISVIIATVSGAQAAAVHGYIYSWSDFEKPLNNVIIEINTIPVQSIVATNGSYLFDGIPPGNFTIRAKYYRNNVMELSSEEDIRIMEKEGRFNIDMLLFPPTDPELEYLGDINLTGDIVQKNESDLTPYTLIVIFVLILMVAAIGLYYYSGKKKLPEVEVADEIKELQPVVKKERKDLPDDLKDLNAMILRKGGRVTQKELRAEMKCSEAKVSLMLDDLEDRGYIKKIKKGRSNIIIAEDGK